MPVTVETSISPLLMFSCPALLRPDFNITSFDLLFALCVPLILRPTTTSGHPFALCLFRILFMIKHNYDVEPVGRFML